MRYGFTTGSCAAAASKAAAFMLLTGKRKSEITIKTPKGIPFAAKILDICRKENEVSCAVQKDGGDDPDITTGALIYAKVSFWNENGSVAFNDIDAIGKNPDKNLQQIEIDGGTGVGRVTRAGLDQPIGNAAINHVPREMIKKELMEVCEIADYKGRLRVEISVPDGESLAKQTFNPRLGIVGGISILGTSGIVEPMSSQSLLDTIHLELKLRREAGYDYAAISPGNYGLDFMKKTYGYDLDRSIKCSNFIGDTIDFCVELGFKKILLTGHIGKLMKVAGGIMNTHSKEADCRMELLAAFAIREGVETQKACQILDCVTTEEAVRILDESGKLQTVMQYAVERICYYIEKRAKGKLKADCILYANELGELARSREVLSWFTLLAREQAQLI